MSDEENFGIVKERLPKSVDPPDALAAEYCEIADDELSTNEFAA